MMEKYIILKLKKQIHFLKKNIVHFVNVETSPRPWYGFGQVLNWLLSSFKKLSWQPDVGLRPNADYAWYMSGTNVCQVPYQIDN